MTRSTQEKKSTATEKKSSASATTGKKAAPAAAAPPASRSSRSSSSAEAMKRVALSDAQEKKLAKVATDLFPENEEMQKATVVYGRKLIKFATGKRSSAPPIPGPLQMANKDETKRRLRTIAKSLDVDLAKVGLAEETAADADA